MATNSMSSSLYQAPQGMEVLADEPVMEIEIENPEGLKIGIDGVEIDLMPEKEEGEFDANLAEEIDERTLATLAADLIGDYDSDINARKDWLSTYVKGLKLLGLEDRKSTRLNSSHT